MMEITFCAALAAGNFLYQILTSNHDFGLAFERSFFQLIAVGGLVFCQRTIP